MVKVPMKRKKNLAVLLLPLMAFAAAAGPRHDTDSQKLTISVANYQMAPTERNAPLLEYFGRQFNAEFTVFNLENQRFHEQLNREIARGKIPDFFYLRTSTTLPQYARLGVLAPLDPETLQTYAPRMVEALQRYAPGYLEMGSIDGVQYGIPVVSPTNVFHVPLVYRGDWLMNLGVSGPPATLGEFETLMYRFTREDPDGNGKDDTWGLSRDGLTAVFGAFGLVPFDLTTEYWTLENGRVINSALSPRAKTALAILARWYRDGIIDPQFITGENQGGYWAVSHAFVEGRIGFTTHGNYYHWIMSGAYAIVGDGGVAIPVEGYANGKLLTLAFPDATLAFGPVLKGPDGTGGIKSYNRLMNFVCIGSPAAKIPGKIERILRIIDASSSPDLRERISLHYGIEGEHWQLVDPETETFIILPPYNGDETYWSRIGCVLSVETPIPSRAPREQWARELGLDRDGIESVVQVGLPLMMRHDAELKALRTKAYIAIITGEKPLSYFDEFVSRYLEAGGAAVQEEVQAYYDGTKG